MTTPEREARIRALLASAASAPPPTAEEREDQAMSFAYGNLACTTNHRPSREAFAKVAATRGWSPERFEAWAASRRWS